MAAPFFHWTGVLAILWLAAALPRGAAEPAQPGLSVPIERIIQTATNSPLGYHRLVELCDRFGPRLSGTTNLEMAIDWILERMAADGLENVRSEPVRVPKWTRGEERAELVSPRPLPLPMLGLGGTVGTPPEGITAELLVVSSFEDLAARSSEAAGKIVLFNTPFTEYRQTVEVRVRGAIEAALHGAQASLVRSITPFSLRTPHTGMMQYREGVKPIPHAAITTEDAEMLGRMQARGERPVIRLRLDATRDEDVVSRNVLAEWRGREKPEEIVVISAHIDSWDVGQGAHDDAGGCVAVWEVARLLRVLEIRPRRTIRVVLWTNEENGVSGAKAYRAEHRAELAQHVLAIETDTGIFAPQGFSFSGSPSALATIRGLAPFFAVLGATNMTAGARGTDIRQLAEEGVPTMDLSVDRATYFWFHHTAADTVDKVNPNEFAACTAALAVMAYAIAELPAALPR